MDDYARLRELLQCHPAGAPAGEEIDEILRILFTPAEVKVAVGMGFALRSPDRIAAEAGVTAEEVRARCEAMADKGIIFSSRRDADTHYALLPTIPGLFEFPFMTGGGTETHLRLAKLWERYHKASLGREFAASPTPLTRVLPIEAALPESRNEPLPYEIISGMLSHNETFALAECACRVSLGRCDQPRDVCLIFDKTGRYLIERKLAREITREQAVEVVRRAEEAGLVHMTNNSQDRLNLICNCCPCCCTLLRGRTELEIPSAFAVSRYVAASDPDECIGCGVCAEERCPMDAIEVDDFAVVDPARCIGCGVCTTTCPTDAMKMQPRAGAIEPPTTTTEMAMKVLAEKGRLEPFLKLMKK